MKPHIIHLGKGEWACGIRRSRRLRGCTVLRIRGAAWARSPSEALRKYLAGETITKERARG